MSATGIHISISAEPLFSIGGLAITNSIFTSLIVSGLLIAFAVAVGAQLRSTGRPGGLQNFAEWIIESLHNLMFSVTGSLKKTRLFFPLLATFFLFILVNNWFGLLPGVGSVYLVKEEPTRQEANSQEHSSVIGQVQAQHETAPAEETHAQPAVADEHSDAVVAEEEPMLLEESHAVAPEEDMAQSVGHEDASEESEHAEVEKVPLLRAATADLNTTIALAIISVIATQVYGIQALGLGYFKKYFNFTSPIMFFVGILELVLETAKIMSFAFRLFGNIFAGEVLLVVIAFLVPVVAPMPFYGLELFVGFVQALVFTMLSLVFFNMATVSHDEH